MALRPKDIYPGQIDETDPAAYPDGAAQNDLVEGDGIGTPLEKRLVNEIFGFQQALLRKSGITPNGAPETALSSQYASAVQVLADRSRCTYAVRDLGVNLTGTADVDSAMTAAEAKIVADFGGGALFFHPGRYRFGGSFVKDPRVNWKAKPGTAVAALNHATADFLLFNSGTGSGVLLFEGIDFEADIDNTGMVFQGDSASSALSVHFLGCRVNSGSSRLKGKIAHTFTSGSKFRFEDCDVKSLLADDLSIGVTRLEMLGGRFTMAPSAVVAPIIGGVDGMLVERVTLHQVSTGAGGAAFIGPDGPCQISRNIFDVDDSGAGSATFAMFSVGSAEVHSEGNVWGNAFPYKYISSRFAKGSRLQKLPAYVLETGSTGPFTLPDAYETYCYRLTGTLGGGSPTFVLPNILAEGRDEFTLHVYNNTGVAWPGFTIANGLPTGHSGVLNTAVKVMVFRALDWTNSDTPQWICVSER